VRKSFLKAGLIPAALFMAAVTVIPLSVRAQDTTGFLFGGYIRSGFGVDGKGGPQDVFSTPLADAKYRLGNEAEAYIETLFGYAFEDKQEARFETNLSRPALRVYLLCPVDRLMDRRGGPGIVSRSESGNLRRDTDGSVVVEL
jgi:hypothetical protein